MAATFERERESFAHIAQAFLGFAPDAVEARSLRPALTTLGVQPDEAEAFAGAITDAALSSLPTDEEVDLSQLVLIGMCIGLRMRRNEPELRVAA